MDTITFKAQVMFYPIYHMSVYEDALEPLYGMEWFISENMGRVNKIPTRNNIKHCVTSLSKTFNL